MRKAFPQEAAEINNVLNNGKRLLEQAHIPQWCEEYPNLDIVKNDIAHGNEYVGIDLDTNTLAGVLSFITTGEPDYDTIEGMWLTQSPSTDSTYAVIHRCAVAQGFERKGVMYSMFSETETLAKQAGCISMRVDTHQKNMKMFALTKKLGYTDCGRITLLNGQPESDLIREGFEKIL